MEPGLEFYEAAAQLIPLLLLTLLVERYLPRTTHRPKALDEIIGVLGFVAVIFTLVLGEFIALRVLARGRPEGSEQDLVTGVLGAGAAMLVITILVRFAADQPPLTRTFVSWVIAVGVGILVVMAAIDVL